MVFLDVEDGTDPHGHYSIGTEISGQRRRLTESLIEAAFPTPVRRDGGRQVKTMHLTRWVDEICHMWSVRFSKRWRQGYQGAPPIEVAVPNSRPLRFALHTKPDIWFSDPIRAGQVFDPHVLGFMQSALHAGHVFVDVGANLGWFSVIGSDIVGVSGYVLAFEPDPDNAAVLRKNILLNGCKNVRIFEAALGAERRGGVLSRSADNQGDHQMSVVNDRRDIISVTVDTMDHATKGIRVDFVKMDTQGSEVSILNGMTSVLRQKPTMVMEFWPYGLERCGATAAELVDILAQLNMRTWLLRPDGGREVSPKQLLELAVTTFHPQTQGHADVAVVRRDDDSSIGYLQGLAMLPELTPPG